MGTWISRLLNVGAWIACTIYVPCQIVQIVDRGSCSFVLYDSGVNKSGMHKVGQVEGK